MKSISELYRIGKGPSSSHTMGPSFAAERFLSKYPGADAYSVTLYGSLAKTGKGHGTDRAVRSVFEGKTCEVLFDVKETNLPHPNTMIFRARDYDGGVLGSMEAYSIGGGAVRIKGEEEAEPQELYELSTIRDILAECRKKGISYPEYVFMVEGEDLREYLRKVWQYMKAEIRNGLLSDWEYLPGPLGVHRKAPRLYRDVIDSDNQFFRDSMAISAYAYAACEENAAGGTVVTAPTCGACGVLPAVLFYMQKANNFDDERMVDALACAGIFGNVIKTNASISGAECGCQAEVGSACSMAASAAGWLMGLNRHQIEYAAEMAMEHHLGLTCDPVGGLVQIPCIERNAVAAVKAINAAMLARSIPSGNKIPFDMIVNTMYETGKDLKSSYRETSEGGLAKAYAEVLKKQI